MNLNFNSTTNNKEALKDFSHIKVVLYTLKGEHGDRSILSR